MAISIKVIKSVTNPLLARRELALLITHTNQPTPDKKTIAGELCSNYTVPEGQIRIFGMETGFGIHESRASAHIYNSADDLAKIEYPYVVARMTGNPLRKIKRMTRKQERVKRRKVFGTEKRNMKKAARRTRD